MATTITPGVQQITVAVDNPGRDDVSGLKIWRSVTNGFVPGAGNLVYDGPDFTVVFTGLPAGTAQYFKMAFTSAIDSTGIDFATSVQYGPYTPISPTVAAEDITGREIRGKSLFAGAIGTQGTSIVGRVNGTEELLDVLNRLFTIDTWWTKGTGWTIGSGVATAGATSNGNKLSKAGLLEIGQSYTVVIDTPTVTTGTLSIAQASGNTVIPNSGIAGVGRTVTFTATQTSFEIISNAFQGTVDNVSLKFAVPATVVPVISTENFPAAGSAIVFSSRPNAASASASDRNKFSYTGKTATSFTGVTGLVTQLDGSTVIPMTKTMVIDSNVSEMRFYGDPGNGIVESLVTIGSSGGADQVLMDVGGNHAFNGYALLINNAHASASTIRASNDLGPAIYGDGETQGVVGSAYSGGTGVSGSVNWDQGQGVWGNCEGQSNAGAGSSFAYGLRGSSRYGYPAELDFYGSPAYRGHIRFVPITDITNLTGQRGDFYADNNDLYYYTTAWKRLVKDNDFGLGTVASNVAQATDVDDATLPTGTYWVPTTATGVTPIAGASGSLFHRNAGTAGAQMFIASATGRMFWRKRSASTWSAWQEVAAHNSAVSFSTVTTTGLAFDQSYDSSNPAAGGTIATTAVRRWVSTGTGTKATLFVNLPPAPADGQLFTFSARGTITAITYQNSAGVAIVGAPTTLGAGLSHTFFWSAAAGVWYPG